MAPDRSEPRRRDDDVDQLPPPSRRQRLLIALAAVVLTVVIGLTVLTPHVDMMNAKLRASAPKPCAAGQSQGCVGGTLNVLVAPAASAAKP
jgi:hypothetical protein